MNGKALVAIAIGGLGLLALSRKPTSANGRTSTYKPPSRSSKPVDVAALPAKYDYQTYLKGPFNQSVWNAQKLEWAKRTARLGIPKTKEDPKYTELYYTGPWVHVLSPGLVGPGVKINGLPVVEVNYYGQTPKSEGGGIDALGIIGMVGNYTLPYIPGYGTAANAALQATVALGQGKSLDEAALAAARGALPPYGQAAFDLGVGVVLQKKKPDQAIIDAALTQLETKYPGATAAYNKGRQMAGV